MQEVYNGKTFPEYFASDEIVAAIEVQNQAGDIEYLYLPTDICSMNKSAVTRKKNQKSKFPRNMHLPDCCSADRNTEESHGRGMAKRRLYGGAATA